MLALSNGYLIVSDRQGLVIYRRSSIVSPPSPLPPITLSQLVAHHSASRPDLSDQPLHLIQEYTPFNVLPNHAYRASKLRFPLLCTVSSEGTIRVWDLLADALAPQFTFTPRFFHSPVYVDFDAHYIYLLSKNRNAIFSLTTGKHVSNIPARSDRLPSTWTCLHYDPAGTSVEALDEANSCLLWMSKPVLNRTVADMSIQCVILKFQPTSQPHVLSLDNGRAVFNVVSCGSCSDHLS